MFSGPSADLPDRVAILAGALAPGRARSDAGKRLESIDSGAIPALGVIVLARFVPERPEAVIA